MKKLNLALALIAVTMFGGLMIERAAASQNTNSSTTTMNANMGSNMNMGRRHWRRHMNVRFALTPDLIPHFSVKSSLDVFALFTFVPRLFALSETAAIFPEGSVPVGLPVGSMFAESAAGWIACRHWIVLTMRAGALLGVRFHSSFL